MIKKTHQTATQTYTKRNKHTCKLNENKREMSVYQHWTFLFKCFLRLYRVLVEYFFIIYHAYHVSKFMAGLLGFSKYCRSEGAPTSDTRRLRRRSISMTPEIGDDIVRLISSFMQLRFGWFYETNKFCFWVEFDLNI